MLGLDSRMFFSASVDPLSTKGPADSDDIYMFLPTPPGAAVDAALKKLQKDKQRLASDLRALGAREQATLQSDEQAVRAAIDALRSELSPLRARLKATLMTWTRKIADAQQKQENLNPLKASGLALYAADRAAIEAIIDGDPRVIAARGQLAAHLPTIAADQATLKADTAALIPDALAELSS